MNINTAELLNKICDTDDIKGFLNEYEQEFMNVTLSELLNELAGRSDMSVAAISRRSGQGDYVYKVFHGERKPSRDIILAIAVGMNLCLNEAQLLLRVAKMASLDPRDKRDSVIIYGIKERLAIEKLNDLLYELDEKTL